LLPCQERSCRENVFRACGTSRSERDRGFESPSLHLRVMREPDFSIRAPNISSLTGRAGRDGAALLRLELSPDAEGAPISKGRPRREPVVIRACLRQPERGRHTIASLNEGGDYRSCATAKASCQRAVASARKIRSIDRCRGWFRRRGLLPAALLCRWLGYRYADG
jgi:hypothetical protein